MGVTHVYKDQGNALGLLRCWPGGLSDNQARGGDDGVMDLIGGLAAKALEKATHRQLPHHLLFYADRGQGGCRDVDHDTSSKPITEMSSGTRRSPRS